jgi:hypothetical protein
MYIFIIPKNYNLRQFVPAYTRPTNNSNHNVSRIVTADIYTSNIKELLHKLVDLTIQSHRAFNGKHQVTEVSYLKIDHRETLCQ